MQATAALRKSGNTAVYFAMLQPGDKILTMSLGWWTRLRSPKNCSGMLYNVVSYGEPDGYIDYGKLRNLQRRKSPNS